MAQPSMADCKYCLEQIPASAKKCRYCGEWQSPNTADKGLWEKAEILGRILSILLIPVILAVLGNVLSSSLKSRDVDMKMVEISAEILKAKPDDSLKDLREWAIKSMDAHSSVPFTDKAKDALMQKPLNVQLYPYTKLPVSPLPTNFNNVVVRTYNKDGGEVTGVSVFYAARSEIDLARISGKPVEGRSYGPSPHADVLPAGTYAFWARHMDKDGPKTTVEARDGMVVGVTLPE